MTRIVIHGTLNGTHQRYHSMEDVIRIVAREANEGCAGDGCTRARPLDTFAHQMVPAPCPSRVRSFVPLLANRGVREGIRGATCEPSMPGMES